MGVLLLNLFFSFPLLLQIGRSGHALAVLHDGRPGARRHISVSATAHLPLCSWGATSSLLLTLSPHAASDPPLLANEVFHGVALPQHPTQTRHLYQLIAIFPVTRIMTISTSKLCVVFKRDFEEKGAMK
jgi:hypothetical protein